MKFSVFSILAIAALCTSACQSADDDNTALIAVATNFRTTFEKLETVFETESAFNVTQVNGATGSLYTQIVNGAPYHAFLSADQLRPETLEREGLASARFTYAQGVLVLWAQSDEITGRPLFDILSDSNFKPIAIANPALAPYGQAAQEIFTSLNVQIDERIVMGENVGQAFALVQSGNARAGFIARPDAQRFSSGHSVAINSALYAPIKQGAALLQKGQNNEAAQAFLSFLQSSAARQIILTDGYTFEMDAR